MNAPVLAALLLVTATATVVVLAAAAPGPTSGSAIEIGHAPAQALDLAAATTPSADDDKVRHLNQLRPLSCFECHSLAVYWDGRPPPADPTPAQAAASASPTTAQADAGDDEADADPESDEKADDAAEELPDPKRFAHGPHRAEGVGHCHQCHALTAHARVTVRLEACRECH